MVDKTQADPQSMLSKQEIDAFRYAEDLYLGDAKLAVAEFAGAVGLDEEVTVQLVEAVAAQLEDQGYETRRSLAQGFQELAKTIGKQGLEGVGTTPPPARLDPLINSQAESPTDLHPLAPTNVLATTEAKAQAALDEELLEHVHSLPEPEATVIKFYYGLSEERAATEGMTLAKIGELQGLTESRISQIHTKAQANLAGLISGEHENRLKEFTSKPPRMPVRTFKSHVYEHLDKFKKIALNEMEVATVLNNLPHWQSSGVKLGGKDYCSLKRKPLKNIADEILETGNPIGRRLVGLNEGSITILTRAIEGQDLQLVFDLENELAKIDRPLLAERFSPRQLEVISHLSEATYGQISLKLGVTESTVRTHMHKAMSKLGLHNVVVFAVMAAREGLIDLDRLPSGATDGLSNRERQLIQECYDMDHMQGAKTLGIACSTFRTTWYNIFKKMGTSSDVQVVLMAMKDGLIPKDSGI